MIFKLTEESASAGTPAALVPCLTSLSPVLLAATWSLMLEVLLGLAGAASPLLIAPVTSSVAADVA